MRRTGRTASVSRRLLHACALFGIEPGGGSRLEDHLSRARSTAEALLRLPTNQIAFITGPSGAGKTLILRELAAMARPRTPVLEVNPCRPPRWRSRTVIDQFPGSLGDALGALARAGLGDAGLMATSPRALSEGERFRLMLAMAMHRTRGARAPLLLIDEFASTLDRTTARNIARMLHRWVRSANVRAVCAAANDDLLESLAPDVLVHQPLHAPAMIVARRETACAAAASANLAPVPAHGLEACDTDARAAPERCA
jgi:ABC-type iron transport system FetAB ATPase subunit